MIDWRETWGTTVHIVNQTSALGAINVAGPKAREVLSHADRRRHLEGGLPVPPPPHDHRRGHPLPRDPPRLRRRGRLGAAPPGVALRGAVGGAARGRRSRTASQPFGIQAQRLLRLEKGHIIVSQDTDFETTPWHVDMGWAVKLDKDWLRRQAPRSLRKQETHDREAGRPTAATPARARALGGRGGQGRRQARRPRHVSSWYSRTLGYAIGLAWVQARARGRGPAPR